MSDSRYSYARQRIMASRGELKHRLEVVAEVTDQISGSENDRPGLASLPGIARQHGAVAVSLSEVDRLSRDLPGGYAIISDLLDTRLDLYSSDLARRVNFRDPDSVKELNDRLRDAHLEKYKIRSRLYDGLLAKAADGFTRRPLSLYGYLQSEPFEPQAVWVRLAYDLGLTLGTPGVGDRLNTEGSRTARGQLWTHHGVSEMLRNPTYKGESGFGRELYCSECHEFRQGNFKDVVRGHGYCGRCGGRMQLNRVVIPVPPLVTPEQWEAVQRAMHGRNVRPGRRGSRLETYPLTGRLSCEVCGAAMSGTGYDTHRYYRCSSSRRSVPGRPRCSYRGSHRTKDVHAAVLESLRDLADRPGMLEAALAAAYADPHKADRERAAVRRADLTGRTQRLEAGYLAGAVSLATTLQERKRLEAELLALPTYGDSAPLPPDPAATRERIRAALEHPLAAVIDTLDVQITLGPSDVRVLVR